MTGFASISGSGLQAMLLGFVATVLAMLTGFLANALGQSSQ